MREKFVTLADLIRFFLTDLDQKFFSRSYILEPKTRINDVVVILEREFRSSLGNEPAHELENLSREHTQIVRNKLTELIRDRGLTHGSSPISVYSVHCNNNTLQGALISLYAHILRHLGLLHDCESEVSISQQTLTFIISPQYLRALSLK